MRGDSSEQRARRLVLEKKFRKPCRRAGRRNSKSCESNRMPRQVKHRLQKFGGQFFPVAQKRLEQPPIGGSVDIQLRCCKIDITMQTRGGPIIERMRERDLWLNPGEPESIEWESFEKRRTSSEWMNCRAEIADALREADRNWVILGWLCYMASCEKRLCARRFSGSFVPSWQ